MPQQQIPRIELRKKHRALRIGNYRDLFTRVTGTLICEPASYRWQWANKNIKKKPKFTLLETNIAFENRPLEKEIPIGSHHF